MGIAQEMQKLADSKQPKLTLEEKHNLISMIKIAAERGQYELDLFIYLDKQREVVDYLYDLGFTALVDYSMSGGTYYNTAVVNSIHIDWSDPDARDRYNG